MYTKQQAINQMNKWGGQQKPFFFMIDFELKKPQLYALDQVPNNIRFDINGVKNTDSLSPETTPFFFEPKPVAFSTYQKSFDKVIAELNYGNSYLLNLTFPTPLITC